MKKYSISPYTADNIHPGFSIDCVILSFHKGKIKVLLNKFALGDYWTLQGGFMLNEEDADQAAYRTLKSRTGLTNVFLKQFHLFSDPNRIVMQQVTEFVNRNAENAEGHWLLKRYVSLGYYALVKYDSVKLWNEEGEVSKWYDIHDLPPLYSDHENIIKTALSTIRAMLPLIPIGYELLPEKFTMTELRRIYEIVLDKTFDRRNFQRKVLSEGMVRQLDEKKNQSTYNATLLYSFNIENLTKFFDNSFGNS